MAIPPLAHLLADLALLYLGVGAALGVVFLTIGIERVAPAARGALGFRPLLLPGIALLWPLVAWRWAALERRRREDRR